MFLSGKMQNKVGPRAFYFCVIMDLCNFPKTLCPYFGGIKRSSQKCL